MTQNTSPPSSIPPSSKPPLSTGDVDPAAFVAAVQPVLALQKPTQLLEFLKANWTREQIFQILRGSHKDARKVAAVCVSLVGSPRCIPELSKLLREGDACLNHVAEHALWSIWFRCGSDEANHQLARGAQAMERRDIPHAITHFNRAIEVSPDFAEAYNQRATAHFLLEEFRDALKDCRETVKRMPEHFGAWETAGHAHAHLGDFSAAIDAYEKALAINPRMDAIRETVETLRARAT